MSPPSNDKSERFVRHLEPLQSALGAFCRRWLGKNRDEVADVLQTATLNAFREFDLYAEGTNFRAWMFRFVSHEVLNRNRALRRQPTLEVPQDVALQESVLPSFDDLALERLLEEPEIVLDHCEEALSHAVSALPDLHRGIFLLRAIGEFKYREIAEILDVPIGTVMGLLARSRAVLRTSLLEYAETHGLLPRKDSK